jgi:ABC-type sugar transport system permease subunit
MKLPLVVAAAVFGLGIVLSGLAAFIQIDPVRIAVRAAAALPHISVDCLDALRARRFAIEAVLLALVAGLHLALLLEGRLPGQKLRRVEVTIIMLYLAVIVVNVASLCVDSMGAGAIA